FLGVRALQGTANAFLTPLVLAGLADASPPGRLGRSIGTFAAVQTAAITLAPLCGGLSCVAIRCDDAFGLGSGGRGLLLAGFGVAGMLAGRPAGRLVDRLGRVQVALLGAGASAAVVTAIGEAGSVAALAALWFVAGASSSLLWAGLNTMTVEAVPANRAGATSVVSAFKFAGNAAAPAMWLPLYALDVRLAFLGAGVAAAATGALTLRLR
ncbi:MAG: MFS transporter, partial [Solirubrobacteraceae bacterium]